MASEVRNELIQQIAKNVMQKMQVKKVGLQSSVPGGPQLGSFDWGALVTGLVNTAASTYTSKELQKTQANLANKLAEAEAKKMLALTELELAKAQTTAQQTALLEKQNELQKILKDIQFTTVQKWMLGGAGVLAFIFGAIQLNKLFKKKR